MYAYLLKTRLATPFSLPVLTLSVVPEKCSRVIEST